MIIQLSPPTRPQPSKANLCLVFRIGAANKYHIGIKKDYLYCIRLPAFSDLHCHSLQSLLLASQCLNSHMDLYIGNLSKLAMASDLKKLFSEFGEVLSANVITDKFNGRSRGFAFVSMESRESGEQAILKLHNLNFMSHTLIVRETTTKESIEQKREL